MNVVELHLFKRQLETLAIDPAHVKRVESAEFRAAKRRLKADGHYHCWICGTTKNIQIHHRVEWMFTNLANFDLVKAFVEEWDPYGYGRLLRHKPIDALDDVRVALALCRDHHVGKGTGIHELDFSLWLIQKLAVAGGNPIPQKGETVESAIQRVKEVTKTAQSG